MLLFFLSSGLVLGWTLGANDAANVFGTAVATKMVRFRTAAVTGGIFVTVGAVISGAGPVDTLGDLGAVNALAGSFMVALAAALAVALMTKSALPVSVSQAIVGGIVGWNLFTGTETDPALLSRIVGAWVASPVLAGVIAAGLYWLLRRSLACCRIHLLRLDTLTRVALLASGAFGAYALGANNIANVMGVFVPAFPEGSVRFGAGIGLSNAQALYLIGGVAIAVGIYTYSRRVMMTVGRDLFRLTPLMALIVVLSQSIVLYAFASETFHGWIVSLGLPSLPPVPVSSSQAVIGAVLGIAVARGGRGVRFGILGRIAAGWVATPAIALIITFVGLFFLKNVFDLTVHMP
ncbi:MAG: inorganic phosphate transporter [Candidatus Eisenbacteria bacterium]|nr:inorganic phosphate transporter [Candidatus Eisenbacteria bacterium]